MVKKELIKEISRRMCVTKDEAKKYVAVFQEILTEELQKGQSLEIMGFGSFTPWKQAERPARNPKTGVPCLIKPRVSVKFKPGTFLLEALNPSEDNG